VGPGALAEAVVRLPWISPGTEALLALARAPTAASWDAVRVDPGAMLLLVRNSPELRTLSGVSFIPGLLGNPVLLEDALRRLDSASISWVDWDNPTVRPVYRSALRFAATAHELAKCTGTCNPHAAWITGLLAPLGWLAVAVVDPSAIGGCLADPEFVGCPEFVEQRHWGLTAAALSRRLARRWRLPDWLSAIVAHLGLPVEVATRLGAEPNLFRVVQDAVGHGDCGLRIAEFGLEGKSEVRSPNSDLDNSREQRNPADVPLFRDLLRLAAQNLRLQGAPMLRRLESDLDGLQAALEEQRAAEAERLREQKLRAMAEFAAGAGHEINNPLAVISGQAQYLLKQVQVADLTLHDGEDGPALDEVTQEKICHLQSAISDSQKIIITQTQRIHQILRDLMQFARPPRPVKQVVDLAVLMRETATALAELATQRRVRLDCTAGDVPLHVEADPAQIRTALACLLRNAVEAAPSGPDAAGWASIRVATPSAGQVEVVIEDNGPGPAAVEREHLFDPFFSGRPAGRGRGLGLPTAWRLTRQHGGDVSFVRPQEGPTRFIVSLPRITSPQPQVAA
jgi:signal transduction histidine kinase